MRIYNGVKVRKEGNLFVIYAERRRQLVLRNGETAYEIASEMMGLSERKPVRNKAVICVDTGEVFETTEAAAKVYAARTGKPAHSGYIWRCLVGYQTKAYGQRWEYA